MKSLAIVAFFACLLAQAGVVLAQNGFAPGTVITTPVTQNGQFPYTGGPQVSAVNAGGGTVTLNGATPVTVANTRVTANSIIVFTLKTVGGSVGAIPAIATITPGTGFTVAGTAGDTSVYNFMILG